MTQDKTQVPESGEAITMDEHGVLQVPDVPIVALVGDEDAHTGIWLAVQAVVDVAVESVYDDERKLVWQVANADEEPVIGMKLNNTTDVSSLLLSSLFLLRQLGWIEAADVLQKNLNQVIKKDVNPDDCALLYDDKAVSPEAFCHEIKGCISDASVFDVDAEQYDELADRFQEEFEAGAEKTTEFAQKAMDKAREQLTVAGKFTEEQGHKLKEFLENDFSRVAQEMKKGAQEKLNPSRLGVGALASMSKLLHKTGVALSSFGDKAEDALTCKSGEITSAGKLVCKACSYEMNFKKTGRIPPCPKCHKTEFIKGY
ncbi:MAG TPA: hypothetical protein EYG66_08150 [Mariprofundaceae bacterium]|nr:hypothetical protein [Mariprofundaceae bacterium]